MPRLLVDRHLADVLEAEALALTKLRSTSNVHELLAGYRFDPVAYIQDKLGWKPWASGDPDKPGQVEILNAYTLALRQQLEQRDYENGIKTAVELEYWEPGQVIQSVIHLATGHTVGKTKLASGIVNHFYDCFRPSIVYTFAPGWEQIHDLLWKEIKSDRGGKGLPGRLLDLQLDKAADWFVKGRATNDAKGRGTERVQGQHSPHLLMVLDEAEGIADYVFDAVDAMTSGGVAIVLAMGNPRTRVSRFARLKGRASTTSMRISSIDHPNVQQDRDVIPGAVRRTRIMEMIADHCQTVSAHDPDAMTFEVPWQPGVIYLPDDEFCWRYLGIAPANSSINTMIPLGRYQAAVGREPQPQAPGAAQRARVGVDVARFGDDVGTIYVEHAGRVWREARLAKLDTVVYAGAVIELAKRLRAQGVTDFALRIDGGGGFGGGVIDHLAHNPEFARLFPVCLLLEVHFNGTPYDPRSYHDLATEMYGMAAQRLPALTLINPPSALESDLCDRTYDWAFVRGVQVKIVQPKSRFKDQIGRSPDDGDGFILCVAPDHIFQQTRPTDMVTHEDPVSISSY